MDYANPDLCKELLGLSNWWFPMTESCPYWFDIDVRSRGKSSDWHIEHYFGPRDTTGHQIPAYNLGYLLRKLPPSKIIGRELERLYIRYDKKPALNGSWVCGYGNSNFWVGSDKPEDALCRLAIKLLKQERGME